MLIIVPPGRPQRNKRASQSQACLQQHLGQSLSTLTQEWHSCIHPFASRSETAFINEMRALLLLTQLVVKSLPLSLSFSLFSLSFPLFLSLSLKDLKLGLSPSCCHSSRCHIAYLTQFQSHGFSTYLKWLKKKNQSNKMAISLVKEKQHSSVRRC